MHKSVNRRDWQLDSVQSSQLKSYRLVLVLLVLLLLLLFPLRLFEEADLVNFFFLFPFEPDGLRVRFLEPVPVTHKTQRLIIVNEEE